MDAVEVIGTVSVVGRALRWLRRGLTAFSAGCLLASAGETTVTPRYDDDMWRSLVRDLRWYGLPIPDEGAQLVIVHGQLRGNDFTHLGFTVHTTLPDRVQEALIGPVIVGGVDARRFTESTESIRQLLADPHYSPYWFAHDYWYLWEVNVGVVTAVQCFARGHVETANALLDASLPMRAVDLAYFTCFDAPGDLTPAEALAAVAWAYWGGKLLERDADRKQVLVYMTSILTRAPALCSGERLQLLGALAVSLDEGPPRRSKADALVADLMGMNVVRSIWSQSEDWKREERYQRLLHDSHITDELLLKHVNDARLTRSVFAAVDRFPWTFCRVADFVREALRDRNSDRDVDELLNNLWNPRAPVDEARVLKALQRSDREGTH